MNTLYLFLFGCIALGLWAPRTARFATLARVVLLLAVALVVFFLLSPSRM